MAFHTFGPGLALDEVTGRGIPAVVAQLTDAETGDPVQAYTMDEVPDETTVSTNRYGYFGYFQVPDTVRRLRLTFGGLTLEHTAWELINEAERAAQEARNDAELARTAAELAAALVDAPADEIIAGLIQQEGSQTQEAVDAITGEMASTKGFALEQILETRYKGRVIRAAEAPATGASYSWAGTPGDSESIKTVDGVEASRNLFVKPKLTDLATWGSADIVAVEDFDSSWTGNANPQGVKMTDNGAGTIHAETRPASVGVPVTPGEVLTMGVNTATKPGFSSRVRIYWYTSSGSYISATSIDVPSAGEKTFTRTVLTGTAPENASMAGLSVWTLGDTSSPDAVCWIDGLTFERGTTSGQYFDGDTPPEASDIIWINDATDVAHTWDGAKWAPIQTTPGKVSFSEFGAAGDGVTDDSDAFHAFVNYLNDNKLDGFIPHGTYRLGKIGSLPTGMSDVKIQGESKYGTKLVFAPTGTPSSATVFPCIGPTRLTFAHMTIDGGMDQHGVRGHGISWRNAEDCHVIDVHIRNHGHSAVMMFANNEDAGIYGRNTIRDTDCDGMNDANNGFLFVNMDSCEYINVTARNGGMSETHSPSCAIQFKNFCTNSRAVNANSYGWKSGLTMGGDTPELGSIDCTMQGGSYGCNYAVLIGKSTHNYVDVQSVGSLVRAVHFAQDATENVVDVALADVPAGQIPISHGFHRNVVNVKYMPAGIAKLVEIGPSVDYTKTMIMAHPGSPLNPKELTLDNSGKTTNRVAAFDTLFDFDGPNPIIKFPTADGKQNWITYSVSGNYMSFRVDGSDRLIIRPSSLASGANNTASLGIGSNGWEAVYLSQPNGTVRKVSVNDAGQLIVE